MERHRVHPRFGHGAARLAIGTPPEATSLSGLARAPITGERAASLLPAATCAALVVGIALLTSLVTAPDASSPTPTLIVTRAWEAPPSPALAQPAPLPPREVAKRAPAPDVAPSTVAQRTPTPGPKVEAPSAPATGPKVEAPSAPAPRPFDPRSLVTSTAPSLPSLEASSPSRSTKIAAARPLGLPTAPRVADLALAVPRSDRTGRAPTAPTATPNTVAAATPRPRAASALPKASLEVASTSSGDAERRAFLASLEAGAASADRPVAAPTALPPVATSNAAAHAVREAALSGLAAEGWRAVPLEDLPDCRPAGRQDALKREILRASVGRASCSHPGGAYRFLETRNLNAFLMWSRTHPEAELAASGPRDACVVLERALRCLTGTPSKELEAR